MLTPEISDFFARYYQQHGVRLHPRVTVAGYDGEGVVAGVDLSDGTNTPAGAVVLGVGVDPVTGYLSGSGIMVDDGIVVDDRLRTSAADVWAAGDAARYRDAWDGQVRRVEHCNTAVTQGEYVARAWTGEDEPYRGPPYFFSDVFDLSHEFWGDGRGADEIVHRADWENASIAAIWITGGRVAAAFAMNRPDEERDTLEAWVKNRHRPPPAGAFADPERELVTV